MNPTSDLREGLTASIPNPFPAVPIVTGPLDSPLAVIASSSAEAWGGKRASGSGVPATQRVPDMNRRLRQALVSRDVARLSIQSATAAVVTYVVMAWIDRPGAFLGVISAVMIIRPSIGSTLTQALDRVAATIVGGAIAVACLLLLPDDYETLLALAISMIVLNIVAAVRPAWRYGFVAAVALSLGADGDAIGTTADRLLAIGIGGLVGTAVSSLVWPNRAETRALRQWRTALEACRDALSLQISDSGRRGSDDAAHRELYHRYKTNVTSAREVAGLIRGRDSEPFLNRIDGVEHLWASLNILRRIAATGDAPKAGASDIEERVETFKQAALEATEQVIEGQKEVDAHLRDEMSTVLEETRSIVRRHDADSDQLHLLRTALVFGLEQIEHSLDVLARSSRQG